MLVQIYVEVDDFCKENQELIAGILSELRLLNKAHPSNLTLSEVMTIMIHYHQNSYKNFKSYYKEYVLEDLKRDFPDAVSYNRFCELMERAFPILLLYMIHRCSLSKRTGIYYVDSSKWEVCHYKRAYGHQVMKGWANYGKSSMGWFFGLKYHLVINQYGEILNFRITSANVADNDAKLLFQLTQDLYGWIFGDKGYLLNSDKRAFLERDGWLRFFTKVRKNMKKEDMPFEAQSWLGKRPIIETVIGLTKSQCDVAHSRHRSAANAFGNMIAGLIAYSYSQRKPVAKINLEKRMLQEPKSVYMKLNTKQKAA